jgi:predicted hydrolase (HD superfamily)
VTQILDHVQRHDTGHAESGNMKVSKKIADVIMKKMQYKFNPKKFHKGMNVEMEHKDVTNGNVVKTAKIAAAHLTENPKYYTLLKKYVEK